MRFFPAAHAKADADAAAQLALEAEAAEAEERALEEKESRTSKLMSLKTSGAKEQLSALNRSMKDVRAKSRFKSQSLVRKDRESKEARKREKRKRLARRRYTPSRFPQKLATRDHEVAFMEWLSRTQGPALMIKAMDTYEKAAIVQRLGCWNLGKFGQTGRWFSDDRALAIQVLQGVLRAIDRFPQDRRTVQHAYLCGARRTPRRP